MRLLGARLSRASLLRGTAASLAAAASLCVLGLHAVRVERRAELARSLERSDAEVIAALAAGGVDVDAPLPRVAGAREGPYGDTLLVAAARAGRIDLVRALLERGADLERQNTDGQTALLAALAAGRNDVVGLLLERGARLRGLRDARGQQPLQVAVISGNALAVRVLIAAGADVNGADALGVTPLMDACRPRIAAEILHVLLEAGADPAPRNARGDTVLHLACEARAGEDHMAKVRALLAAGAPAAAVNPRGVTPLHAAAAHSAAAVDALLAHGADPAARDHMGRRAIHVAAASGPAAAVESLLAAESGPIDADLLEALSASARQRIDAEATAIRKLIEDRLPVGPAAPTP